MKLVSLSNNSATTRSRASVRDFANRVTDLPPWVVLVELFIGLGWLRAASEKMIDPQWWDGTAITDFISAHDDVTLGWYQPFVDAVVIAGAPVVAAAVLLGQLIAGISLTTFRRVGFGLGIGMFLNAHFMSAGAVTPSAFYLLAQGALALWMSERSRARHSSHRLLVAALTAAFVAAANLPFISTLHPDEVIEDPAIMFVLGGSLTTLTCMLAMHARSVHATRSSAVPPVRGAFSTQVG